MSQESSAFSEEDRELFRASLRRFLAEHWPALKAVDLARDPRAVRRIWRELEQFSFSSLGGPELGALREVLLAFEELGRSVCPAPLLGAVAANILGRQESAILEAMAAVADQGELPLAALALGALDGDAAAGRVSLEADRISGTIHFVEGAVGASCYLVLMDTPAAVAIVPSTAPGIEIRETPALSLPALASVSFADAPAVVAPLPRAALDDVVQVARLCCAARALGSAQRGFELVVEYAKMRQQFGQLIGQFQAVQHRLVDNATRLDGARLTLDAAATAHDRGLDSWRVFTDLALAHSSPGLRQLALDMHQLMGAIGYAEEHELPRHFRQIHGNLTRLGGVLRARAEIGRYLVGNEAAA